MSQVATADSPNNIEPNVAVSLPRQTPFASASVGTLVIFGCLLTSLYLVPYVVLGKQAQIRIHDNIEPNLAIQARLASDGNSSFILGGLPPAATIAIPRTMLVVHRILPPFEGYLAWDAILRIIAFLGMFGLLRRISPQNGNLACLTSVAFAWLPFFNVFGLAVAGLPSVALAAIWLTDATSKLPQRFFALLIIAIFPAAAFIAILPFVAVVLAMYFSFQWILTPTTRLWLPTALLIFTATTVMANWPYFEQIIRSDPILWHRVEFVPDPLNLSSIRSIVRDSFFSHYHAAALPTPFVWCAVIVASLLGALATRRPNKIGLFTLLATFVMLVAFVIENPSRKSLVVYCLALGLALCMSPTRPPRQWTRAIFLGIGFMIFTAAFWMAYDAEWLNWLPLARSFQYSRWYFFLPVVFSGMFFFSLSYIATHGRVGKYAAYGLVVLQLVFCIIQSDWYRHFGSGNLSFAQHEARDVFNQVDDIISVPKESYRIACVGFYPSSAHLNGFNTVGGYWNLYPLSTKHAMRRVIAGELDKSPKLKSYFDEWGNRCYVWSSEIPGHEVRRMNNPPAKIESLEIDIQALRNMGAKYIFSSLEIGNHGNLEVNYLGTIASERASNQSLSLWIYEIDLP